MKPTFGDYLKAAFNARPIGMFVPPNWIGLGAIGLLGLLNPGIWILGAGLELGYLYALVSSERFRRTVRGTRLSEARRDWETRQRTLLRSLDREDQFRYRALEERCEKILRQQRWASAGPELEAQSAGLGRLLWIYQRLLLTRQSLRRVVEDSTSAEDGPESIDARIVQVEQRLEDPGLGPELRKSLESQVEILRLRRQKQAEARAKTDFLEAELTRIEEQVELIREQAVVAPDAETVSQRIDQVAATLGGTTQWISEQQQLMGRMEELLVEPPPMLPPSASEVSA